MATSSEMLRGRRREPWIVSLGCGWHESDSITETNNLASSSDANRVGLHFTPVLIIQHMKNLRIENGEREGG